MNIPESVIQYDPQEFPFSKIVGNIFDCHNLMLLHQQTEHHYDIAEPGSDQGTEFHKQFYQSCADLFLPIYKNFIKEKAGPFASPNEEFLYQRIPTFRVQLPDNKAVGGISHRDKDYNHPPEEINFLVPLTSMIGSNSLFVESAEGLRDFRVLELHPGQLLIFNGANLEHGNLPNTSGWTRVSFDFRILRKSDSYNLAGKESVAHGLRFIEGEYYASSNSL